MTAKEAINILEFHNPFLGTDKNLTEAFDMAIKALTAQQWIPYSITPPELGVDGNVLLYGKDGNYAVGWYNGCYRSWDVRFDMETPVAWRELPEPWEGE